MTLRETLDQIARQVKLPQARCQGAEVLAV
jgi:hypothetical protein